MSILAPKGTFSKVAWISMFIVLGVLGTRSQMKSNNELMRSNEELKNEVNEARESSNKLKSEVEKMGDTLFARIAELGSNPTPAQIRAVTPDPFDWLKEVGRFDIQS